MAAARWSQSTHMTWLTSTRLPPPSLQVMDVAVMALAGRMMAPHLAAGLSPSCYYLLAVTIFGVGPSLMGLAYDRLVLPTAGAAGAAGGGVASVSEQPLVSQQASRPADVSKAAKTGKDSPQAAGSAGDAAGKQQRAAAAADAPASSAATIRPAAPPGAPAQLTPAAPAQLTPSQQRHQQDQQQHHHLAWLDLRVLLLLCAAQALCCVAAVLEGFYGPWPFPVACTLATAAVVLLRLLRPAAYMARRMTLLTTVRTVCSCFALFNAVLWTLGVRDPAVYGRPGVMAVTGASVAVTLKIACLRVHLLAHVVLQVRRCCLSGAAGAVDAVGAD
jgi:hypothetical protein